MDKEDVEKLFKGIKNRKLLKDLKETTKKAKPSRLSKQKKTPIEETNNIFS